MIELVINLGCMCFSKNIPHVYNSISNKLHCTSAWCVPDNGRSAWGGQHRDCVSGWFMLNSKLTNKWGTIQREIRANMLPLGTRQMPVLLFYGKMESDEAGRFAMLLIFVEVFSLKKKNTWTYKVFHIIPGTLLETLKPSHGHIGLLYGE